MQAKHPLLSVAVFAGNWLLPWVAGAIAHEQDLASPRVYFDQSHWVEFGTCKGACDYFGKAVDLSLASLSGPVIAAYDVVIVSERPDRRCRPEEVAALCDYVRVGGGLLIYGTASADLAAAFGIGFTGTRAASPLRFSDLFAGASGEWKEEGCLIAAVESQCPVVCDAAGNPVAAAAQVGMGRVIAMNAKGLVRRFKDQPVSESRRRQLLGMVSWLGANRIGNRSLKRLETGGFHLHPGEQTLSLGTFTLRYSQNLPAESLTFVSQEAPRIFAALIEEFGYGRGQPRSVWLLPCSGSGFTAGNTVGIGACGGTERIRSVLIHELSNSLCVDTPVWLGDAGFSRIMHSRIRQRLGGEFREAGIEDEKRLIQTYEEYERDHGPYDITTGQHYTVGAGKLLSIIRELEQRHGGNMVAGYFTAAREWRSTLIGRGAAPVDRMAFYFSVAAGEDLFPYFRQRAFPVEFVEGPAPFQRSREYGEWVQERQVQRSLRYGELLSPDKHVRAAFDNWQADYRQDYQWVRKPAGESIETAEHSVKFQCLGALLRATHPKELDGDFVLIAEGRYLDNKGGGQYVNAHGIGLAYQDDRGSWIRVDFPLDGRPFTLQLMRVDGRVYAEIGGERAWPQTYRSGQDMHGHIAVFMARGGILILDRFDLYADR